ncbi:MAG TPA: ParA family protein [Bacteroidetes bacterium]|nr:ParA family protein [Bacteroidota bacterium]
MSKIIAITNQKGGVGKTTTAINLASSLAVLEKKVLLIDSDPQSNATSGLGITSKDINYTLYDAMTGKVNVEKAILNTDVPNLDILPSTIDLVGAEVELVNEVEREYVMRKAIIDVKKKYDYIFIDCLPSLGILTINALVASDSVIIPVQSEYYSLEGLGKLKDTINAVKDRYNPNLNIEGILITMFDKRLRLAQMVVDNVREIVTDNIFDTIINRNSKVNEAPMVGKPVILYDASAVGSKNYLNLAYELLVLNNDSI